MSEKQDKYALIAIGSNLGNKKLNIEKLSLETGAGDFFIPARKLFNKSGFSICKPFSHYKEDINSVYMSMLINN